MTFSYYPGCTLKTQAKDLDLYARKAAAAFGISLEELPEWQCCGACYPVSTDEIAHKLSAVRVLKAVEDRGQKLVTVCSACHNVLKRVNRDVASDKDFAAKVTNYLGSDEAPSGTAKVVHFLEMLRDEVGFDKIREKVSKPLTGVKIAAYYGCLLLRPGKVMAFDDPENPSVMEDFIRAVGATPVKYPMRNECCGGYLLLEDKEQTAKQSGAVLKSAKSHGAEMVITACPLCLYNLKKADPALPVRYFTEILAEALD